MPYYVFMKIMRFTNNAEIELMLWWLSALMLNASPMQSGRYIGK